MPIHARFPYEKQFADVVGQKMAYVDVGEGDPIVFLHGNPTSSYLWRNVMPHLEGLGRLIAPDLIGQGDSSKLPQSGPDRYRFVEHFGYLEALLHQIGVTERVVFVIHDWGSGLGFHWANTHRDAIQGIAFMEAIATPVTWSDWPEAARAIFQAMRSPAGESIVLDKNTFVERILPASIQRSLTDEEMAEYRRPFSNPGEDRRPTLTWPRQIPIDGEPADVAAIVKAYGDWLSSEASPPKLFINADPGSILIGRQREFVRSWPHLEEVTVPGLHFIQEDSPDAIGTAVANFVRGLRASV
ncbi:MAG: haloalkane dehalogenase [Myxococcota bacterium]